MNIKIKNRWLAKLESGKYKKGNCFLKVKKQFNHFDALGVLCEVYLEMTDEWPKPNWKRESGGIYSLFKYTTVLPTTVREWAGLTKQEEQMISYYSDSGRDFSKVIKYIEEL